MKLMPIKACPNLPSLDTLIFVQTSTEQAISLFNFSFNKLNIFSHSRRAIYEENCFKPPGSGKGAAFLQDTLENMCLEKRAFYRAVSGLHSRYFVRHLNIGISKEN